TCLTELGGFNEQLSYYHDETDLCLRIIDNGYRLVPLDAAAVYHKYAKSDIRSPKITFDPYFAVCSQYIFALQNGKAFYTESQLHELLSRHVARVIDVGIQ